jgi:Double-GTPase 2
MPPKDPGSPPPKNGPPSGRGITMLGASKTGKTTFLASLQIALLRHQELGWSLTGDNPASTKALIKFMDDMTQNHKFPQPTGQQIENYRWSLEADRPRAIKEWHWWGYRRRNQYIRIALNLVDSPGEAADGRNVYSQPLSDSLVANMARSTGIVLFFDPVTEFQYGNAFRHTHGILTQLKSQAAHHGKLPHHVAVCITKFDEIPVLRSARALKVVEYDPENEFPGVPDEYAKEFFKRLVRLSKADNASLILPLLQQSFYEDRVRFFVTSAIGFYIDPSSGKFDPSDYQNNIPGKPDRIRGEIFPINVLEPILWLSRSVARTAP